MLRTWPNLGDWIEFCFFYHLACQTLFLGRGLSVSHNLAHCLNDWKPQTNAASLLDTKKTFLDDEKNFKD